MKSMFRMLAVASCMTVALPALAQFDGDQNVDADAVESGPSEFLAEGLFAAGNCDVLSLPAELEKIVDRAAHKIAPNAVVCVLPGQASVTLNLKFKGMRIIALKPGTVELQGAVYVNAPTVLFGLKMDTVALDKGAAGSVLAVNVINKAIANTGDVTMIGNVSKNGKIEGPMGHISTNLHLPHYARHLSLASDNYPLSAVQNGHKNVAGWLPRSSLSTTVDTEAGPGEKSNVTKAQKSEKQKATTASGMGLDNVMAWFDTNSLVAHTSPNREGEQLKRGQDVPMYRNPETTQKAVISRIFVPLHTGLRPEISRMGIIFGLTK